MSIREPNNRDSNPSELNFARAQEFEQHIRHLDRLATLGKLTASLAHEIKNSLVASKTFFDLMLEKNQDAELTSVVRRELARVETLVTQMVNYANPSRPVFAPIRLHEVLDHSLRLVRPQLEAKSSSLKRAYAARSDLVHGNEYELEQAFVNLLLNASEAMNGSGTLTVATELIAPKQANGAKRDGAVAQQLRITIQDTGIGIQPENLDQMFQPFFTTKEGGTGLGLTITQRIIEEHGGNIGVISQPNHGATFQILLPVLKG